MRIAFTNWSARRVGGIETYLQEIIPALCSRGHVTGLLFETAGPAGASPLELPTGTPSWSGEELGPCRAVEAMRAWRPDVVYGHGMLDPRSEALSIAGVPSLFFVHTYYGTCVSGSKTHRFPRAEPCSRRFGLPCLARYYPRRCGGWSPVAMARAYALQHARLRGLRAYSALVTHSEHMRSEYLRHGFPNERVHVLPYCAATGVAPRRRLPPEGRPWRLLFAGRMDELKGGGHLLDAIGRVASTGVIRIDAVFAGDGSRRAAWERKARELMAARPAVRVEFTGWLGQAQLGAALDAADVVVVPSVLPEPFGRIGLEATLAGIPVVAFDVGGVREWLLAGVNGLLAPSPPSPAGLADALRRLTSDATLYTRLAEGGQLLRGRFLPAAHADALVKLLQDVAAS